MSPLSPGTSFRAFPGLMPPILVLRFALVFPCRVGVLGCLRFPSLRASSPSCFASCSRLSCLPCFAPCLLSLPLSRLCSVLVSAVLCGSPLASAALRFSPLVWALLRVSPLGLASLRVSPLVSDVLRVSPGL